METIGLIFSAGNETRFNGTKPKALSMIGDVCLLDRNVEILKRHCNHVYVVCSPSNECWFFNHETIVIRSGNGCGDAVYKALRQLTSCNVIIAWGDCVLDDDVVSRMLETSSKDSNSLYVPCVYEKNPYVSLCMDENEKVFVSFGKYGETCPQGLHDYGCFYSNRDYLFGFLSEFHNKFFDYSTLTYNHKHGNEMQFLDVINETDIDTRIIELDIKANSFNTIEELKQIEL